MLTVDVLALTHLTQLFVPAMHIDARAKPGESPMRCASGRSSWYSASSSQ